MVSLHNPADPPAPPQRRAGSMRLALVENLYCDLLVLCDDVRAGIDDDAMPTDPLARVQAACESLRLTAQLMQFEQWLTEMRERLRLGLPDEPAPPPPIGTLPGATLPTALERQFAAAHRLRDRACDCIMSSGAVSEPEPHRFFRTLARHFPFAR